jgi:hypothetical protein
MRTQKFTHHPPGASHTSFQHRSIHLEDGRALHRQALSKVKQDQKEGSDNNLRILNK